MNPFLGCFCLFLQRLKVERIRLIQRSTSLPPRPTVREKRHVDGSEVEESAKRQKILMCMSTLWQVSEGEGRTKRYPVLFGRGVAGNLRYCTREDRLEN